MRLECLCSISSVGCWRNPCQRAQVTSKVVRHITRFAHSDLVWYALMLCLTINGGLGVEYVTNVLLTNTAFTFSAMRAPLTVAWPMTGPGP